MSAEQSERCSWNARDRNKRVQCGASEQLDAQCCTLAARHKNCSAYSAATPCKELNCEPHTSVRAYLRSLTFRDETLKVDTSALSTSPLAVRINAVGAVGIGEDVGVWAEVGALPVAAVERVNNVHTPTHDLPKHAESCRV